VDVTRLRVALARLARRLRKHELAGLTPTQLAGGFGLPAAVPLSASIEESFTRRLASICLSGANRPRSIYQMLTVNLRAIAAMATFLWDLRRHSFQPQVCSGLER